MNYMEVLAATFSTFFFGIIFSLTGKKLIYSSFAGGLGWYTHLLFFKEMGYSKTTSYLVSAMIIAIFSEIISRLKRTTVTTTLDVYKRQVFKLYGYHIKKFTFYL